MSQNDTPPASASILAQIALTVVILLAAFSFYLLLEINTLKDLIEQQQETISTQKLRSRQLEILDDEGRLSIILKGGSQRQGLISIQGQEGETVRISSTAEGQGAVGVFDQKELISFVGATPEGEGLIGTFKDNRPQTIITSHYEGGRLQAWANDGQTYVDISPIKESFPTGQIIPKVTLKDYPQESYALYLPKNYSSSIAYPVLFFFTPTGDGSQAIRLVEKTAQELNWIVVASNSYHGGAQDSLKIAYHLERDVHMRLAVERGQYYAAGFSWGGWLASWMARTFDRYFAGVIPIASPCFSRPREEFHAIARLLKEVPHIGSYFLIGEEDSFRNENEFLQFYFQYGRKVFSLIDTYPGGHQLPSSRFLDRAMKTLHLTHLVKKSVLSDSEKVFVDHALKKIVEEFQAKSSSWDKITSFTPLLPWLRRLDRLSETTQELLHQTHKDFDQLRQDPSLTQEIEAQSLLVNHGVQDHSDLKNLSQSLESFKLIETSFPQTAAAKQARKFQQVIQQLIEQQQKTPLSDK